jgi:hypothetical protein
MPEKHFFKKNTISFWEKIDMLGGKIGYKIDGQSSYKIHFGGFLTIIITGMYLYFLTMMLIPFLERSIPRISFQNYKDFDPPSFLLKDKMKMAFKINFPGAPPEKNISYTNLFNFNATYFTINSTENIKTVSSEIKYQKSNVKDYNGLETLFSKLKLEDSLNLVFEKNMVLEGSPISEVYSYFKIDIYLKNYTQQGSNEFLALTSQYGCNLQIFYSDISLQLSNYTSPFFNFISFYQDDISFYETRKAVIDFSLNSLTEQDGYLFYDNSAQRNEFLIHQSSSMKFNPRIMEMGFSDPVLLYSVTVNLNKLRTDYVRSYMMVPELLSILGGNLYFLLYLFGLIYNYVNEYLFNLRMIEETFELDRDGLGQFEIIQPRIKKKISKFELVHLERLDDHSVTAGNAQSNNVSVTNNNATATHHSNNISHDDLPDKKKKKKSNQIVPIIKKRRPESGKSYFSSGDICQHLFLFWMSPTQRSERKRSMYIKAKSQIDAYMDILSVTKRLIEIDLLKYLIFNEEQFQVCGMIGKPYISLNETHLDKNKFAHSYLDFADIRMKSNYELAKMNPEKKLKISHCFEKISKKDKKSIIDKKLIDSVEDNIDLLK